MYNLGMIHILHSQATPEQIAEMSKEYETMIKIVVDIRRRMLAGGGEMRADCEQVLLENGSEPMTCGAQTGIPPNSASSLSR
jgi:hypothetical protein